MKASELKASEFDRMFDDGEDISAYIDWSRAERPGLKPKRIGLTLTTHKVNALDRAALKAGVTRQALIEAWLTERLDRPADASTDLAAE